MAFDAAQILRQTYAAGVITIMCLQGYTDNLEGKMKKYK